MHSATETSQQAAKAPRNHESIGGVLKDGRMYETVWDPDEAELHFMVHNFDGTIEKADSILVTQTRAMIPPKNLTAALSQNVVRLASGISPYGSRSQLLKDVLAYIHRYADVPDFQEELMAHYIMMTWMYDKFNAVGYVRFLGDPQTGKSRLLQIIHLLSYRGIMMGPGSSMSPLFRLQDAFHGTILFDEADFGKSDMQSDIVKILNGGYTKGFPLLRAASAEKDFAPESYDVYGPKVIANRGRFMDEALESRCMTFQTTYRVVRADVPRQFPDVAFDEAAELRNKLLNWRMSEYHTIEVDEAPMLALSPRKAQISIPIYSISPDKGFKKRFLAYMTAQDAESKAERPVTIVLEVLSAYADGGHKSASTKAVSSYSKDLASKRDISTQGDFETRRINDIARSLGFTVSRLNTGREIFFNAKILTDLRKQHELVTLQADVNEVMKVILKPPSVGDGLKQSKNRILPVVRVSSIPESTATA